MTNCIISLSLYNLFITFLCTSLHSHFSSGLTSSHSIQLSCLAVLFWPLYKAVEQMQYVCRWQEQFQYVCRRQFQHWAVSSLFSSSCCSCLLVFHHGLDSLRWLVNMMFICESLYNVDKYWTSSYFKLYLVIQTWWRLDNSCFQDCLLSTSFFSFFLCYFIPYWPIQCFMFSFRKCAQSYVLLFALCTISSQFNSVVLVLPMMLGFSNLSPISANADV